MYQYSDLNLFIQNKVIPSIYNPVSVHANFSTKHIMTPLLESPCLIVVFNIINIVKYVFLYDVYFKSCLCTFMFLLRLSDNPLWI